MRRGAAAVLLLLPLLQTATATVAAAPCDIYKGAGTPCAAAHSVVRALFAAGSRPLYQLRRYGDNATLDIYALPAAHGGVANASAHTDFCSEPHPPPPPPTPYPPHWPGGGYPARADCVVSIIYDQTGNGNHLLPATPVRIARIRPSAAHSLAACGRTNRVLDAHRTQAINNPAYDLPVNATRHPITVGGHKAYGAYFETGMGYRAQNTTAVATGNAPETICEMCPCVCLDSLTRA
jgi:hypothetical protein